MNISIVKNCTGCLACKEICPKKCISTTYDTLGHVQAVVDTETCIDCGLCTKTCPEITPIQLQKNKKVYASYDLSEAARIKSSSGGLATLLAEEIINSGGIVYGCAFEPPFKFKHIRCNNIESLERLRGSKYVQSNTDECWGAMRNDIKEGKKILFIGTPCQVAAACRICKNYENLYTIDLICHGVPSVDMLKRSLPSAIEYDKIANIKFRDNTKFRLQLLNKKEQIIYTRPLHKDWYLKGFFTSLFYRESCYNCKYAQIDRAGDITLGDFWGVRTEDVEIDTTKGVSAVLVNTDKGNTLIEAIKEKTFILERSVAEVREENKQLNHSSKKGLRAKIFKKIIKSVSFNTAVKTSLPLIALKSLITSIIKRENR